MTRKRQNPTRERILHSSAEAMTRLGYARASVKEMSAGAHVTTGAFYDLFESKEQVAREIVQRQRARVEAAADGVRRRCGEGATPIDRLGALWFELICLAIEDPIVCAAIRLSTEAPEIVGTAVWEDWLPLISREVNAAADAGEIPPDLAPTVGMLLACICVGVWAMRPWGRQKVTMFAAATWALLTKGVSIYTPAQRVPPQCWLARTPPTP